MKSLNYSTILVCLILLSNSCQYGSRQTKETYLQHLLVQTKSLHCKIADLSVEAKTLWDSVNAGIEARLPADMPSHHRINMLRLRNARMIREFEVYPQLGEKVHMLVDSAEQVDIEIAEKMRIAMDSLSVLDSLSQKALVKLAEGNQERYTSWKYKFVDVNCLNN